MRVSNSGFLFVSTIIHGRSCTGQLRTSSVCCLDDVHTSVMLSRISPLPCSPLSRINFRTLCCIGSQKSIEERPQPTTMPTKSIFTSNLIPPSQDQTYTVPRAYFWIVVLLCVYILPWVLILVLVDNAWWAFGPLFANWSSINRLLFYKTVKFTIAADHTVTHNNMWGKPVCGQTQVPMSNYEQLRLSDNRVTFVKTNEYYDAIVDRHGCYRRCIPFEETYFIQNRDAETFATNHGFDKEENV